MSSNALAVVVMIVSTFTYSVGFVLQHKGSQTGTDTGESNGSGFKGLLKNKYWVAGVVLFLVAGFIHIGALSLGSVSIVQPLLVTELLFIPPLSALIAKTKVAPRDWVVIGVVSAALAGFLIVARPESGSTVPTGLAIVEISLAFLVLIGVMATIGSRLAPGGRAACYGAATACINAWYVISVSAALLLMPALLGWASIALAGVLIVGGIVAATIAFKAGPITYSTPALITVNPLVATVASMWLFGDSINDSPVALAFIAIFVAIILWGVIQLSRTEAEQIGGDEMIEPPLP